MRAKGSGTIHSSGHIRIHSNGAPQYAHRLIAARVLGRNLTRGEHVHHVDGDRANNATTNLVICPGDAYHKLLHQRTAALDACGKAHWRKCKICKRYDEPSNLLITGSHGKSAVHSECNKDKMRRYRQELKEQA